MLGENVLFLTKHPNLKKLGRGRGAGGREGGGGVVS